MKIKTRCPHRSSDGMTVSDGMRRTPHLQLKVGQPASSLTLVGCGGGAFAENGLGCREQRRVIVVAETAQETSDKTERPPNEKIGGNMLARLGAIAAASLQLRIPATQNASCGEQFHGRIRD